MNRSSSHRSGTHSLLSSIQFTETPTRSASRGLLGFVTFRVAEAFVADSIAVRRTRDGRLTLSFPILQSRRGRRRTILHPIDQFARNEIERVVLAAVREQAPWLFDSVEELSQ